MPDGDAVGGAIILLHFLEAVGKLRKMKVGDYKKLFVVSDGLRLDVQSMMETVASMNVSRTSA